MLGIPLFSHSIISDSELDSVIELLVRDFPNDGIVMMWGQLRSMNIVFTRQRVHDSLLRVSPIFTRHRLKAMLSVSGIGWKSHITGSSVYNQWIERL